LAMTATLNRWAIHTAAFRVGPWRNAMLHLFVTPSPLLLAGEVLVGMSLPMFVAALIVAFGEQIKLSGRRGLGGWRGPSRVSRTRTRRSRASSRTTARPIT
jgi:hypothetical protein